MRSAELIPSPQTGEGYRSSAPQVPSGGWMGGARHRRAALLRGATSHPNPSPKRGEGL